MANLTTRGVLVDEIAGIIQEARAERFNPDASTHTAARRILEFIQTDLAAAQDEIERRITECESHRNLVDAAWAERKAEVQFRAWKYQVMVTSWRAGPPPLDHPLNRLLLDAALDFQIECCARRRAVVDSIGGA